MNVPIVSVDKLLVEGKFFLHKYFDWYFFAICLFCWPWITVVLMSWYMFQRNHVMWCFSRYNIALLIKERVRVRAWWTTPWSPVNHVHSPLTARPTILYHQKWRSAPFSAKITCRVGWRTLSFSNDTPFRCPRAPPSHPFTFLSSPKRPIPKKKSPFFFTFLSAVQIICFSAYYLAISDKFANFGKVFREIFSPENLEGKKKVPTFAPAIEKQAVLRLQDKKEFIERIS